MFQASPKDPAERLVGWGATENSSQEETENPKILWDAEGGQSGAMSRPSGLWLQPCRNLAISSRDWEPPAQPGHMRAEEVKTGFPLSNMAGRRRG